MSNQHCSPIMPPIIKGKSISELVIKLNAYPHDRNLCLVNACSIYLERTRLLRGNESSLFITHQLKLPMLPLWRLCKLQGGVQQPPLPSFMTGTVETAIKDFLVFVSCAISCLETSRDFVVRLMTRQNRKLNDA